MTAEAGFGVVPLEQVRTMDGLTLIKGLMEGRFPAPPISEVLGFVGAEGPITIGRLSDLLATDRTTLTRNLRPLLHDGLIERAASGDKRRHELVATPAGRALFKRALPLWVAAEQEVRAAMGSRLTADLHGALDRSMEKLAAL